MADPRRIRTRAEWTAALQGLFSRAGLSYHVLSERCEGIATSTLQQMVTGQSFPRASTVRLFVQACGESDTQPWVDARNRVAAGDVTASRPQTPPAGLREARVGKDPVIRPDPRHVLDYAQTVRRFAPTVLRDREAELAKLREFCLRPSGESYCYWRGTAWAGKTALLATFVLVPLMSEVTFVAFFIRAGDQDDYQDFLRVVTRQLGVFLGEIPPSDPSRADLDSMLGKAAEKCHREGRRLVLVVDGLDEDWYANRTKRDLTDMLEDSPLSRQLLGLIVAAETGLSIQCLTELARKDEWEVERCLGTVSGRVLHRLGKDSWTAPDRDGSYQLAHTDLRELARNLLGKSLDQHRQRIFIWAEEYRQLGWPSQTPEYLLRGYFRMLDDLGDLPRMSECATDLARRDRMRDLSGGDAAALTEIITTQDVIVTQEHPDLIAMVRLAIHRDHLAAQNENMPFNLPPLWALLGQVNRAEAIARSTPNQHGWDRQADVLASVAEATARTGNLDRAEITARSITNSFVQAKALVSVAGVAAETGDFERAAILIDHAQAIGASVTDPSAKALTLASVAGVAAGASDSGRAATLIDQAEATAHSITDADTQARVLVSMAEAIVNAGDLTRAGSLIMRAEAIADSIRIGRIRPDPFEQERAVRALALLADAVAKAGDFGRAGSLIVRAEAIADSITCADHQARALVPVAEAVAKAGDFDRASTLILRAEAIADSITNPYTQASALVSMADAAAKVRDFDRAEAIADSIDSAITPKEQAQAFLALTASQDPRRRARAVARALRIADWHLPIRELIKIAPEALTIVLAEIDTVTRSDAS